MRKQALVSSGRWFAVLLLALAVFVGVGCQTETVLEDGTKVRNLSKERDRETKPTIQTTHESPPEMYAITGKLVEFRTRYGFMPDSLQNLVDAGLVQTETYPDLAGYAYRSRGLGLLNDGRMVMLVDHTIRINGFVWCVWSEPNTRERSEVYTVGLVPMRELEQAASS